MSTFNLAIVQHSPVYGDKAGCLDKMVSLMKEALDKGAHMAAFGETWFPGYPAWIDHGTEVGFWDHEPVKEEFARLYQNSISMDSAEITTICDKAKEFQVMLALGINEVVTSGRGQGTIYNSFLLINSAGKVAVHHRKLMPTYTERLIYGTGDAHGLQAMDSDWGKIGGLICWEHWMPLTRHTMHEQGEDLHIGVWPFAHEMVQVASRQYAFEGRCYVAAVGQIMRVKDVPQSIRLKPEIADKPDHFLLQGGSALIDPRGQYMLEPQLENEGIFVVEIPDLKSGIKERMNLDITGHYSRPDLFKLQVNKERL